MPPMIEGGVYNELWMHSRMQRLDTVGGQPTGSCRSDADAGNTDASYYECDYVLAFTPLSFPTTEGVEAPDNCFQALPLYGEGVQEYQFWDGEWILSQPVATLRAYSTKKAAKNDRAVVPGRGGLVGSHFFAEVGDSGSAGSGAGWVIGGDCSGDSCSKPVGRFRGALDTAIPNGEENIALLLVARDEANTPQENNLLSEYAWMQRLETDAGIPPALTGAQQGQRFASNYTCAYVLNLCVPEVDNNDESTARDGIEYGHTEDDSAASGHLLVLGLGSAILLTMINARV